MVGWIKRKETNDGIMEVGGKLEAGTGSFFGGIVIFFCPLATASTGLYMFCEE